MKFTAKERIEISGLLVVATIFFILIGYLNNFDIQPFELDITFWLCILLFLIGIILKGDQEINDLEKKKKYEK